MENNETLTLEERKNGIEIEQQLRNELDAKLDEASMNLFWERFLLIHHTKQLTRKLHDHHQQHPIVNVKNHVEQLVEMTLAHRKIAVPEQMAAAEKVRWRTMVVCDHIMNRVLFYFPEK